MMLRHILMAPVDGDGESGGGGAATVDFGNDYTPTDNGTVAAVAAATAADADAAAEATAAEKLAAANEEPKDNEPPRDETGKFTKKDKSDEPLIPKARFDEQLGKERTAREAAERRAAEAEAQIAKNAKHVDIQESIDKVKELRAQERKALIDGNDEKAASLAAEADALNRQIVAMETRQDTHQELERVKEEIRVDTTIERLTETYPALREGDAAYDQDLVDDILDKQIGLMERERLSPSRALAKAASIVMERYAKHAPDPTQRKDPEDEPKDPDGGKTNDNTQTGLAAAERKAAAVAKNVAASTAQPGSTKDVGLASDKAGQTKAVPNANDMEFEEFAALPEATRAKMRGDFV